MASPTQKIIGIDFSGARDAGKHIWISAGKEFRGILQVSECQQASNFLSCTNDKWTVFTQLVDWIDSLNNAIIGIDFPFGVPEVVINSVFCATSWKEFVNSSKWMRLAPNHFRRECVNFSNNELRDTDAIYRADCPHSIRIYKQTFHGIRDILQPLLHRGISVAPMVNNSRNITVLETYPAATLAREDGLFAARYKNRTSTRSRRKHNVQELSNLNDVDISGISAGNIVNNRAGNAMDSIIAALATFRVTHNSSPFNVSPINQIEGHIYV